MYAQQLLSSMQAVALQQVLTSSMHQCVGSSGQHMMVLCCSIKPNDRYTIVLGFLLCVVCLCAPGAAASAAIAIERGTFSKQEWEEQLGPDPAKLDNTVRCAGQRPYFHNQHWRKGTDMSLSVNNPQEGGVALHLADGLSKVCCGRRPDTGMAMAGAAASSVRMLLLLLPAICQPCST